MKGLLIKDFALIKNQKQFIGVMLIMVLVFLIAQDKSSFVIGYAIVMSSSLALTTISYDEFNNGTAFLFTFPFFRKDYVLEKYIFGSLMIGIASVLMTILVSVLSVVRGQGNDMIVENVLTAVLTMAITIGILALSLPLQFKFGAEKSRMALMGVIAGVFLVVYWLSLAGKDLKDVFSVLPVGAYVAGGIIIEILLLIISYKISVKIIENKEY